MSKLERARRLWPRLASLAAAVPIFRPGTALPGASAPFLSGPASGASRRASERQRLRRSLAASTAEGMVAEIVGATSGGAVLTGWALHLGASPLVVGLLVSAPSIAQVFQLPAAYLTARLGRRRLAIAAVGASRLVILPLALLPLLPLGAGERLAMLIAVTMSSAIFGILGNNAWVSWMSELVPERLRGRYFGKRTALCTVGGTLAGLATGIALDRGAAGSPSGPVLSVLAGVAAVAGVVAMWLMARQHEPAELSRTASRLRTFLAPLVDRGARATLLYLVAWGAASGLGGSFFTLHMLGNLRLGFATLAVHGAGVAAARVLAAPLWGRAIDRLGVRPALALCSFALAFVPLLWLSPSPGVVWPLAIDALLAGVFWSGHGLAAFALPMAVAPRAERPFYLGLWAMAGGLATAAAAMAGGALAETLPVRFEIGGRPMYALHVLFVATAVARLAAACLALRIRERGAGSLTDLVDLARQPLRRAFRNGRSRAVAR